MNSGFYTTKTEYRDGLILSEAEIFPFSDLVYDSKDEPNRSVLQESKEQRLALKSDFESKIQEKKHLLILSESIS